MNTEIRKIVLIPRYTAYAGARTFLTPAVNVREFANCILSVWGGLNLGTLSGSGFSVQVQVSMDLDTWTDYGDPIRPVVEEELDSSLDLAFEWMRLAVSLTGTNPAITCWATGSFATRTPARAGN